MAGRTGVVARWGVAVAAVAATIGLGVPALAAEVAPSPSPDAPGTTWSIQPADRDGPDGRVSLRHVIAGGGEVADMVAVTNYGDRPATYAVYASDGVITEDGNFDLLPPDQEAVDGGAWIAILPTEGTAEREGGGILIEIPAESTVVLPVQVQVPANATPGDHPAGIVAELVQGDSGGVQLASRVGVRIHLRVAGDVIAELRPEDVTATYSPSWNPFSRGTITVEFAVANTGNVRLGSTTEASAAGMWGIAEAQASAEQREVLPGQSATTTVEIQAAPLFVAWGDVTTTPVVVGDDQIDAALASATSTFKVWTIPWSQLVLIVLLVGAFFLVRALRRRHATRIQDRIDAAVAQATGQAANAQEEMVGQGSTSGTGPGV